MQAIARQSEIVGDVRGIGLMLRLEIVEDKATRMPSPPAVALIRKKCEERGVIIHEVDVAPPLIITREEADRLCDVLSEAIAETEAERTRNAG